MPAMRAVCLVGVMGFCVACGPGYSGDRAKTPEEIVAEEERQADEDERRRRARGDDYGPVDEGELDADKRHICPALAQTRTLYNKTLTRRQYVPPTHQMNYC